LLVIAAGMLSKQRRQGKRGNILLAMPQARFSMNQNFTLQNSKNCARGQACRPAGGMADKS
jgi:hypothetical protein